MAASSEIPPRVRQFATELAQPQPMRRGSVSERLIKCGKAGCACARDPKARHGPYQSLTAYSGEVEQHSGLKPNSIPGHPEHRSERSDAGLLIVREVFGLVKRTEGP